ncbi:GNAT family N-acetyltransferase [Microlunatus elymi]|uniref:GNAT family N-acetyltransferase n=1 Tax=Microlunatus elymi TaxID=2596828 RepID=A0A516PXK8_9ACTN|nr:GNAT family protein [Microlunatus elymi]QDP95896.1 GNAT family N-acetyltransferase [Microlunatus elymi]
MISDGRVSLRTLTLDDLDALVDGAGDGRMDAPTDRQQLADQLRSMIEKSPTLDRDGFVTYGIEVDGELVGDIQARAPKNATPPGVCELGITLFPGRRGAGIGTGAVRLLTDDLIVQGWQRIQAGTAVGNRPMRRVLEKLGFFEEGVMRGFAPGPSGREDYVLYARLATDR